MLQLKLLDNRRISFVMELDQVTSNIRSVAAARVGPRWPPFPIVFISGSLHDGTRGDNVLA